MNENEGDPDCQERASLSASSRLPWKMKKTMADGEKDEAERGKHRRRRKGDRDIFGDEREGSPPEKMLCNWLSPEKMLWIGRRRFR